jgi:hypothetical protein
MAMTLVKKTADYRIYQRGDERYAVKDAFGRPINADDKVAILLKEGLVDAPKVKAPEPEAPAEEEAAAEDGEESPAEES